MKIIRDQGQRSEPGRQRRRQAGGQIMDGPIEPTPPARPQFRGQHRVGAQQAAAKSLERRQKQGNAQDDEERKLKAGLEQLLGVPEQDDETGGGQGIEEVARPFERPADDDDAHHDGRANRGRLPAGGGGVKPDERENQPAAKTARELQDAQERDQYPGD